MRQKKTQKQLRHSGTTGSQKFGDKYFYMVSFACLALFVLKATYTNENYSSMTPGTQILHLHLHLHGSQILCIMPLSRQLEIQLTKYLVISIYPTDLSFSQTLNLTCNFREKAYTGRYNLQFEWLSFVWRQKQPQVAFGSINTIQNDSTVNNTE